MPERIFKPWFAAKRYGYGASWPIAWQGWAALVVFLAAIGLACVRLAGTLRVVGVGAIVVGFALVCAAKTEGGWRWRWGRRP